MALLADTANEALVANDADTANDALIANDDDVATDDDSEILAVPCNDAVRFPPDFLTNTPVPVPVYSERVRW